MLRLVPREAKWTMGEATRKRKQAEHLKKLLASVDRSALQKAVNQVVRAITDFHGADCLLYASVGAGLLNQLGVPARAAAGSAAWRVGPGDSDLISHAPELAGPQFQPANIVGHAVMFHAWIEVGDHVIDLTTGSLSDKARMLDQADGGSTRVEWCPSALWMDKAQMPSLTSVRDHPTAGVCAYIRKESVEKVVLSSIDTGSLDVAIHAAVHAYRAALTGTPLQVIGVGDDGHQTEPSPGALQRMRG